MDYDEDKYISGDVLMDLISGRYTADRDKDEGGVSPLLALLVIAVGIFNIAKPDVAWYLEYGWRYKDAEPFDLALTANRFGGGFTVFLGAILFLA